MTFDIHPLTSASWRLWDVAALLIFLLSLSFFHKSRRLPPGPKRLPIIGNALVMPKEKEWLTFTEWQKKYGDIVYLSVLGRSLIILNSAEDAYELLFKRSNIYSERPHLTMAGDLMGWKDTIVFLPYGHSHRHMRRLMHQTLTPETWPVQEMAATKLLGHLLNDPGNFSRYIRHMTGSIILKLTYGYDVIDPDHGEDPFVELAEKAVSEFSVGSTAGAFVVDFIPWLKYIPAWFPGATFQRLAATWRKDLDRMIEMPFEWTKKRVTTTDMLEPSLVSLHIPDVKSAEEEHLLKWAAGSMYSGGADTTVSSITSFFRFMCMYPEVQAKAQAELDKVIGHDRLPGIADRKSLPYVEAVMKEILRLAPVAPGGVPHLLSQNDLYKGYDIPANSIILPNIWAMTRDSRYFPDPEKFYPERYLEGEVQVAPFADPLHIVFGFGRRVCPGQRLAEASVFISIAMVLSTFNIGKQIDAITGKPIEPVVDVIPGTIVQPVPFQCKITPRSRKATEAIEKAMI